MTPLFINFEFNIIYIWQMKKFEPFLAIWYAINLNKYVTERTLEW